MPAWAPGVAWAEGACGPKGEAWEAAEIPGAGLGLRATRALEPGEELLSVPLTSCWPSAQAAAQQLAAAGAAPSEEEELSEEALVALWLCGELHRGSASPFAGQIAALPADFGGVLQWSGGELAELNGSCFHAVALGLREETDAEWEAIGSSPGWREWLRERPALDLGRFQWAKAAVMSRQLELEAEGVLPEGTKVVVPGFDLLNHDAGGEPNCSFEVEAAEAAACVVVRCARAVAEGEELRISYGPLPNASLLISHGFVAEDNPFDCVELVLSFPVPLERRAWLRGLEAAAEGLAAGGVPPCEVVVDGGDDADASFEYSLRHNLTRATPLPPTLLGAVRLQAFSSSELPAPEALCAAQGALQAPREQLAMERLTKILRGLLNGHPTSVSADKELLRSSGESGASLPMRQRMAVAVRLAEKEILSAALAELGA